MKQTCRQNPILQTDRLGHAFLIKYSGQSEPTWATNDSVTQESAKKPSDSRTLNGYLNYKNVDLISKPSDYPKNQIWGKRSAPKHKHVVFKRRPCGKLHAQFDTKT